ncbi:MAG: DsbC family protein [Pseudomonadota bacterium]
MQAKSILWSALVVLVALLPVSMARAEAASPVAGASVAEIKGPAGSETLLNRLRANIPNLPISAVTKAEIEGFFLVELSNGQLLYGSADGNHLFSGDLYRMSDKGLINLAEARRAVKRKRLMDSQPVEDMVVFAPAGETKTHISIFTDVDCGYCRKLHQEMAQINALGIEVRYLAYPRAGLGTATYAKIVSAWCADNPNDAITALKSGLDIPSKQCSNPVAAQYELGQQVGVTGTPAIVTEDGRLLPGYMPAAQLAQAIGLE